MDIIIDDVAKNAILRGDEIIVFNGGKDIYFKDENGNYAKESGEKLMYNGEPVSKNSFLNE